MASENDVSFACPEKALEEDILGVESKYMQKTRRFR